MTSQTTQLCGADCVRPTTHGTDDPAVRICDMCGGIVPTDPATGNYLDAMPQTTGWQPIETAPHNRPIVVYAPGREGLQEMASVCLWHPDAGFCIDELRRPSHWMDKPA